MREREAILIGVGNPFRSDDGLGRVIVRRLREEIPFGIQVLEETGDGAELLEAWKGADWVIVVDAVQSGAPPGTIHRFDARTEKLPTWFSPSSTHSFGVAEAVELARRLGEMPGQLIAYGIEGLDFSLGTQLSPDVAVMIPAAAHLVLREIRQLLGSPSRIAPPAQTIQPSYSSIYRKRRCRTQSPPHLRIGLPQ